MADTEILQEILIPETFPDNIIKLYYFRPQGRFATCNVKRKDTNLLYNIEVL